MLLLALWACTEETPVSWEQYNAGDNTVSVEVGAEETLPAVSTTLTSNTGSVEIGTGSVDPGGGPIDTLHTVRVELDAAYADDVGRVTVRTDSGDRGEDEYELDADSTGEGIWVLELRSVGDVGEVRTDTVTFRLWYAVEDETATEEE